MVIFGDIHTELMFNLSIQGTNQQAEGKLYLPIDEGVDLTLPAKIDTGNSHGIVLIPPVYKYKKDIDIIKDAKLIVFVDGCYFETWGGDVNIERSAFEVTVDVKDTKQLESQIKISQKVL